MPRIEIIVYDDDGNEVTRLSGIVEDITRPLRTVVFDPVASLARRNGIYTKPAAHMLQHPKVLQLHSDAVDWCMQRSDCAELATYARHLHEMWWLWHDTHDLDTGRWSQALADQSQSARRAYAVWLATMFEAHGKLGVDGRYTVKRYLAAFRRGELKPKTFDQKMDAARERLEMLRRGIK